MNSIRISITAGEQEQDILISELSDLGALGFEQTDELLIAYFPELNFKSYEINEILKAHSFETGTIADQNWNEVWENNFQPVLVEDFCLVRAHFHETIPGIPYDIIITPKMSFGTGHHATTYMMMAQMKEMDFKNRSVFDFGTGTGILAILAEKLGAKNVLAIDYDQWSIDNAKENISMNQCSKITLELSAEINIQHFNVILANINRNVILDHITNMYTCLYPGGYLLLSGLLTDHEAAIIAACTTLQLKLVRKSERNNWISLLFIK